MANYKKKTVAVKIPFTYAGVFYKDTFKGTKKEIDYLTEYLKQ